MDQEKYANQKLGQSTRTGSRKTQRLANRFPLRQVLDEAKQAIPAVLGVFLLLMSFNLLWTSISWSDSPELNTKHNLRFSNEQQFRITVFEDLHFGEGEDNPPEWGWGPASDLRTINVMETILDLEEQDLVVLNGDLITGENTHRHNSTRYLDQIVAPLVERGLPWASTYGNHDRDVNLDVGDLFHAEQKYALSLTRQMVTDRDAGVTNYFLAINSPRHHGPALLIWVFDSRGGRECHRSRTGRRSCREVPDTVHPSVAKWFRSTSKAMNMRFRRTIPAIAFVHIPIHAMRDFQQNARESHKSPGINDDNPLAAQGERKGAHSRGDKPFMQALQKTQGLKAVFSGHDHGNDWCQKWNQQEDIKDLFLCFGRHTGYGGYGRWMRGSRQIRISLDEENDHTGIETWVRLEDGSVSGRVDLNGTFGKDEYPKVRRKFSFQDSHVTDCIDNERRNEGSRLHT